MFVKPGVNTFEPELFGPLLRVRIPHTHMFVPDEGMEVPETGDMASHWRRALRDGDVVLVEKTPASKVA